jgi:hypothetical protein
MVIYPRIFQRKWGENPPLTRNCEREDFIVYGHYLVASIRQPDGKADEKIALKPGDFGIR